MEQSYFDGSVAEYFGIYILANLLIAFTLGLGAPWALCMLWKWQTDHSVVNGKRLVFNGSGSEFFGSFIIWIILTCITFGIYSFWMQVNLQKYRASHTKFLQ